MTFTQLRAFATVARLGSLSAAAHTLGVTEPAVAAALAAAAAEILGLEDLSLIHI